MAFWGQAEIVAAATDLAEVIGGAIALHLLFGVPLVVGGVISIALLSIQNRQGQRPFELVVIALLVIVTLGFFAGLVFSPPSAAGVLGGMVPRFEGVGSLLVAASMLGATSCHTRSTCTPRSGRTGTRSPSTTKRFSSEPPASMSRGR